MTSLTLGFIGEPKRIKKQRVLTGCRTPRTYDDFRPPEGDRQSSVQVVAEWIEGGDEPRFIGVLRQLHASVSTR